MAFSMTKKWNEGTISKLAVFFAFIFVAIGVVLGAVLERIEAFRPLATKVQTMPRLVTRLKERIA
jgi:O-antigen/teichoic acid export membrane protein